MNSPSIYDDLKSIDLGEKVEKLKEHNAKLRTHIQTLEQGIEKLCNELTKMKNNEDNLKRNISSLFKTSKVEIERKDRMIAELRKQLDDLLFKRSNIYSNRKSNEEHYTHSREPYFNKRRYEILEPDPNKSKRIKSDSQGESHEINKSESASLKVEYQQPTRVRESSKNLSKSPPRRSRSCTRHKVRYRDKTRSRSRDKHSNHLSRDISRERDRSRGSNNNQRRRSSNRNEKNNILHSKDLREVLDICKSKEETVLKSNDGNKNCNTVIKEALHRISTRHNKNINNTISNNSNPDSNNENCENNKSDEEIVSVMNAGIKEYNKNCNNENKTVKVLTESIQATSYHLKESESSHYDNQERCVDINVNSDNIENLKPVLEETSFLKDILNNGILRNSTRYSPSRSSSANNYLTNNILNGVSLSDNKLDIVQTESETIKKDFELNSDPNGLANEENIAVSTINNNKTSMNTSRRRRCVIKIVT